MKITRRDFLKVAGVVGATAAMAGCAGMAPGAETAASSAASAATSTAAAGSVAAATGNMELTEPVQLTFAAQEVGTAAYNYAAALQSVMLPQLPAGSTIDITTTSPGGVGAPMIVNGGEECDLVMSNAGPAKWSYEQSPSEYEFGGCTEIACLAGDLGQNFINVMFTQKFVDTTGYKTFEEVVANKYPVKMVIKKNGSFGEQTAEKVCEALGITFDDIESWGGKVEKTGFFVDQRENRSLLERYAKGRSVLNMFCYTGGFSVYAMRGDAKLVHSVDSSAKAIDLTNKNIELNFPGDTRHAAYAEDAFKYLDRMGDQYDLIVLDPPAFAKHRDALRNALQGYRKLNVKAFEKIKPGGILFTFSCSQAVSKENFRTAVFTAAAMSGRSVRILHQLTQPADHPVSIYHPEGEYLKGLVLYVE